MCRAILASLLLVGCSSGTVTATVTDGLTGGPMQGVVVLLRAQEEVSFSCQYFEGTTDAAGVATIAGPCLSSTSYGVFTKDETLWLSGETRAEKGSDGVLSVEALRAPNGSGAYLLSGGSLAPLSTHGDLKSATIVDSEEVVEFPARIPAEADIPSVGSGSWLVLVGADTVDSARLIPLVKSDARRLGRNDDFITMQEWWYLGVRFASDTEFTRQAAMIDESKVIRRQEGDRAAYIVPHDALPAGRYALRTGGSNRVTVLDFGPTGG